MYEMYGMLLVLVAVGIFARHYMDLRGRSALYEHAARHAYSLAGQLQRLSLYSQRVIVTPLDSRTAWLEGTPAFMISLKWGEVALMEIVIYIGPLGAIAELWSYNGNRLVRVPKTPEEEIFWLGREIAELQLRISDLSILPLGKLPKPMLEPAKAPHEVPQESAPRIFCTSFAN